jgi:hypothetical protein
MNKKFGLFLAALILIGFEHADAVTISSETEASSSTFSESLSGSGPLGGNDSVWDWDLDLNHTKTTDTSVQGSSPIVDETSEVDAGLAWDGPNGWSADGALSGSTTPQENLKTMGVSLGLSCRVPYGQTKKVDHPVMEKPAPSEEVDSNDEDEDYAPSLTLRATVETKNFNQTFGATRIIRRADGRTVTRAANGSQALNQKAAGLSVKWAPAEKWRFKVASEVFSYDRDVASFMSLLESPLATQRGFGSLTNTVGGLPNVSYSAAIDTDLTEKFGLELKETYSIISEDLSSSYSTRIVLGVDLSDLWKASMGVNVTQSNVTGRETAGIIGVEASF